MFLAKILRNVLFLSIGCLTMALAAVLELEGGDEFAGNIEEFAPTQREDFNDEGIIDNAEMPMVEEVNATSKPRIGGIRSRKDNSPLLIALQPKNKGIQDETATTGVNAGAEKKRLPPDAVSQQEPDPLLIHQVMVGYPLSLDLPEQAD